MTDEVEYRGFKIRHLADLKVDYFAENGAWVVFKDDKRIGVVRSQEHAKLVIDAWLSNGE